MDSAEPETLCAAAMLLTCSYLRGDAQAFRLACGGRVHIRRSSHQHQHHHHQQQPPPPPTCTCTTAAAPAAEQQKQQSSRSSSSRSRSRRRRLMPMETPASRELWAARRSVLLPHDRLAAEVGPAQRGVRLVGDAVGFAECDGRVI